MKLVVTALARRDLRSISKYTLETWGRDQLQLYVGAMLDRLDDIAANPSLGQSIPNLPKRFRRVAYRSHLIFYTEVNGVVRIIRILHQRMDHARHLN